MWFLLVGIHATTPTRSECDTEFIFKRSTADMKSGFLLDWLTNQALIAKYVLFAPGVKVTQ